MNPSYGITKDLPEVDFEAATTRVTDALKAEGFGVLTEIDVKDTLRKKLGVEFPRYRILGSCNPPLAHRALKVDPAIGLLLPCNVVVAERPEGGSVVSAVAPHAMFSVVDNPDLGPVVEEVSAKLTRVIEGL